MAEDFQRRMPCRDRLIADIGPDDVRVRVVGLIIDKVGDSLIVDDSSGKITVMLDAPTDRQINEQVRILGRVMPVDNGYELHGELVQDMKALDTPLYRNVMMKKG